MYALGSGSRGKLTTQMLIPNTDNAKILAAVQPHRYTTFLNGKYVLS